MRRSRRGPRSSGWLRGELPRPPYEMLAVERGYRPTGGF